MIQAAVTVVAPPNMREELLEVLSRLIGPTEAAPGCQLCRVLSNVQQQDEITYYVRWNTELELAEHFRSERFRRVLPYIELSMEPPEVEISQLETIGGMEFLVSSIGGATS